MWYECQWDNSPSKSQFTKVNHYRSRYGLQHGALACKTIVTLFGLFGLDVTYLAALSGLLFNIMFLNTFDTSMTHFWYIMFTVEKVVLCIDAINWKSQNIVNPSNNFLIISAVYISFSWFACINCLKNFLIWTFKIKILIILWMLIKFSILFW